MNEYYEEILPHLGHDPLWGRNTVRRWKPLLGDDDGRGQADRHVLVDRYAWAIPTDEAIAALAELSPLVEIGAGRGYWAHLLRQAGADIIAYDRQPRGGNVWHARTTKPWTSVLPGTHRMTIKHPDRALFLCWPPYDNPMASRALRLYNGSTVAYVGEGSWGCTADSSFHEALEVGWRTVREVTLPQWEGIHDRLTIHKRRSATTPFTTAP